MDKKRKGLLVGMIFALAAGTGTAAAMVINDATAKSQSGAVDSAVYFEWGESQSMQDIGDLKAGSYVYRKAVVAAPSVSASANQKGTVTFTLSASTGEEYVLTGIKVEVLKDEEYGAEEPAPEKLHTLKEGALTWADSYDLAGATSHYYSLRISYDGTAPAEGKTVSANLNVALSTADKK